jgi:hypothetical protein
LGILFYLVVGLKALTLLRAQIPVVGDMVLPVDLEKTISLKNKV